MASKSHFLPSSEVHDELIDSGTVPQARLRPKTCPRKETWPRVNRTLFPLRDRMSRGWAG